MPSSLMIVALAAAWLVVLVPMVARKRQEIARTGDDAMASRVVRTGGHQEESEMVDSEHEDSVEDPPEDMADVAEDEYVDEDRPASRYRPGRGGFDPEAAEIAARAKYAFRQRVVVALLATVLISAGLAMLVLAGIWWVTGAAFAGLVGYLGYLRRQVRIETEIRERRLARLGARSGRGRRPEAFQDEGGFEEDYEADYEVVNDEPMPPAGVERKPRPHTRLPRRNTVVVDVDDEDPAFHELDRPGPPAYRRAVGE